MAFSVLRTRASVAARLARRLSSVSGSAQSGDVPIPLLVGAVAAVSGAAALVSSKCVNDSSLTYTVLPRLYQEE